MTEVMIQVREEVYTEARNRFLMAFELVETAVKSLEGTDDTVTQTLVKCACEKMGEAGQLFTDMDPRKYFHDRFVVRSRRKRRYPVYDRCEQCRIRESPAAPGIKG